jgi:hypothetical protein
MRLKETKCISLIWQDVRRTCAGAGSGLLAPCRGSTLQLYEANERYRVSGGKNGHRGRK